MGWGVFNSSRFHAAGAAFAAVALAAVGPITEASAQTTQIFSAPNTQITDTMLRNGQYATFNHDGPLLLTRWSSVPDWERRTIFNFETGSIPSNATIVSAVLTLTVKTGSARRARRAP